jgi:glutamyl endopeptidase
LLLAQLGVRVNNQPTTALVGNNSSRPEFRSGSRGALDSGVVTKPKSWWQSLLGSFDSKVSSIIGDEDDRTPLFNTRISPWRMVCALEIEFADLDRPRHGTGWLAGPNCIATAGHCLFDHEHKLGEAIAISVFPGRFGNHAGADPFGSAKAVAIEVLDSWRQSGSPSHDLGAIKLDRRLGDELGWFAFGATSADAELGRTVQCSGYSERLDQFALQLRSKGSVTGLAEGRLFYTLDTMPGGSGAPIMAGRSNDADQRVVAVHAYDETETPPSVSAESNSGTWLDEPLTAQIESWANAWNA